MGDHQCVGVSVHESAYVDEGVQIGKSTCIWHFCHILTESKIGEGCRIGQKRGRRPSGYDREQRKDSEQCFSLRGGDPGGRRVLWALDCLYEHQYATFCLSQESKRRQSSNFGSAGCKYRSELDNCLWKYDW